MFYPKIGNSHIYLGLGARRKWVANFTQRWLYPWEKNPRYPFNRKPGGPRADLDLLHKRKMLFPCRDSNPRSSKQITLSQLTPMYITVILSVNY